MIRQSLSLPFLTLSALALVAMPAPLHAQKGKDAPPGMVLIKGGRTKVGLDVKDIEKLINDDPTAKNYIRTLDSTTPQHSVTVEPFYMMLTETTNEQFVEFVQATNARPPYYWAPEAIDGARHAFLEDKDRDKTIKFDPAAWWDKNWREQEWSGPKGVDLVRPVVFVRYQDAVDYCTWAGLRLPSEQEYQRAVRGNGEELYPWGSEWEDGKYAATNEIRSVKTVFPVGHFPEGNNKEGIYDLAGNVWEWTTSPYDAFDGWKSGNEYEVGKGRSAETLKPESKWDPAYKVMVGGAFVNDHVAAMCTTRRSTAPYQQAEAMGFRAVRSSLKGRDLAEATYRKVLANSRARGEGVGFQLNSGVILEYWKSRESSVTKDDIKRDRKLSGYEMPEGYRVITGYEHIQFVPRDELAESGSDVQFARQTRREPQQLGFLSLTEPMLDPVLAEGTYLIAYRAGGKFIAPDADPDAEAPEEEISDPYEGILELDKDNILFLDAKSGELVGYKQLDGSLSIKKGKGGGTWTKVEEKVWAKDANGEDVRVTENWLQLDAEIATSQGKRYLPLTLKFKPSQDFFDQPWLW